MIRNFNCNFIEFFFYKNTQTEQLSTKLWFVAYVTFPHLVCLQKQPSPDLLLNTRRQAPQLNYTIAFQIYFAYCMKLFNFGMA